MGSQGGRKYSQFHTLAKQSSFYSLTLDGVQNQLGDSGKPLGSMNIDELLKNIWSVEANQAMGMDVENAAAQACRHTSAPGLRQQESTTLAQTVSKKTVDEVWREIQQGKVKKNEERKPQEQPILGEMTLEDFLMKAGVVPETVEKKKARIEGEVQNSEGIYSVGGSVGGADPISGAKNFPKQAQWMQQNMIMNAYISGPEATQHLGVSASPLLDIGYSDSKMVVPFPLSDTQTPGRKRVASGDVVEKFVERRQKRMIKNRESAARSRARKQAYTNELEYKVSRLEEENESLKKKKELDKILHCSLAEPKNQLRRTSSAPL